MSKVPYVSVVGYFIYTMVLTRLDIAYAISVVSKFMLNLIRSTRGLWNRYWDTWEELQTWLIPRAKRQDDDLAMGYVDFDYVGDLNKKGLLQVTYLQ